MFSALPFCIVLLTVRHVAGVNYNPNGSAFLWLPSDDYSGSNFFEWVIMYVERWCIFMVSLSAAGHFSVSKIQQSASLEMPPPHSFQVDGYWVHISVEMSSESCPSHTKPHIFSSRMHVASSINQSHLPMDLCPFRETEQLLWRRMIHPIWLTVYSVIGEFWLYFLRFSDS